MKWGVALLLTLFASELLAAERVALVIGNDGYTSLPKLMNARNDAVDVAAALKDDLGFSLIGDGPQLDKTREQILSLLETFSNQLQPDDVALFYFAGHGVAESGNNWLVPVDDQGIKYREDVTERAVSQRSVLGRIENRGDGALNLVILDACRNNPLPSRNGGRSAADRGLERLAAPYGTFIAYAADRGQTALDAAGRNGLFTGELIKRIRSPGLRVDDLFQEVSAAVHSASRGAQTPVIESKIKGGKFHFKPDSAAAPDSRSVATADSAALDLAHWQSAQSLGTVEAFRDYQQKNPEGRFAMQAQMHIAALKRPGPQAQTETKRSDPDPPMYPNPLADVDLEGFSCGVNSYGSNWARQKLGEISNDLYEVYGCTEDPGAHREVGSRGDFHAEASDRGPWRGFAWASTVLYYDEANKSVAERLARSLTIKYRHKFHTLRGAGQGVRPDWYPKAIIIHLREQGH